MGYQTDTPASVIFQATQQLRDEQGGKLATEMEKCSEWKDAVLQRSQYLLLQMATPDALVRLQHTALASNAKELTLTYFTKQHHGSISDFLRHYLKDVSNSEYGSLFQVCHKCVYFFMYVYNDMFRSICKQVIQPYVYQLDFQFL